MTFVVAPGADPGVIRLAFEGAQELRLDAQGALVLRTAAGEVRWHPPVIYQEVEGNREKIAGRYVRTGPQQVGFEVVCYDASRPLVIDPVLSYSTYLGGPGDENGLFWAVFPRWAAWPARWSPQWRRIAIDDHGNAYVTGRRPASFSPRRRLSHLAASAARPPS